MGSVADAHGWMPFLLDSFKPDEAFEIMDEFDPERDPGVLQRIGAENTQGIKRYFSAILVRNAIRQDLNRKECKILPTLEGSRPNLDHILYRQIALPQGSDEDLGALHSSLVEWHCSPTLRLEPALQQWWNEYAEKISREVDQLGLTVPGVVDDGTPNEAHYTGFMKLLRVCMEKILEACHLKKDVSSQFQDSPGSWFLLVDGEPRLVVAVCSGCDGGESRSVAEARGKLVSHSNRVYERVYKMEKEELGGYPDIGFGNTCRGLIFTGDKVQAVSISSDATAAPVGRIGPAERLLDEACNVDTSSDGFKVLLGVCLLEAWTGFVRAAQAEAAIEKRWKGGGKLTLTRTRGYYIGHQFLETPTPAPTPPPLALAITTARLSSHRSLVLSVKDAQDHKWWLKLGPNRDERLWELCQLRSGSLWEDWFRVERDMLARCLLADADELVAFPVEVPGCNRPAMLIQDAGSKFDPTKFDAEEMSEQLRRKLKAALDDHGLSQNDIRPENVVVSDAGECRLIDWGRASWNRDDAIANLVASEWPQLSSTRDPAVDMLLCPDRALQPGGISLPVKLEDVLQGLFYCFLWLVCDEHLLPWKQAAESRNGDEVLRLRREAIEEVKQHTWYLSRGEISDALVDFVVAIPR